MAGSFWGKVYFGNRYAGQLREDPGGRCVFTYDTSYLDEGPPNAPAIAHTLPMRSEAYVSEQGLHPFFDNLGAEGWLRKAQARALGVGAERRFALLLGFGHDLAGAVSIEDPEPQERRKLDPGDEATVAALLSRASLSGIQRKLPVVAERRGFRPVALGETSTHIAKLATGNLVDLLEVEFLTTQMVQALLPDDNVVEMKIARLPAIGEEALIITRFDRTPSGKRLHFEEFNQLLGKRSGDEKYEGSYDLMGEFIRRTPACVPAEGLRLVRRVLACLLVGNTDAHFKNFAMFHTRDGLRLTPSYDLVAASIYPQYQSIALLLSGHSLAIGRLHPKHLLDMAPSFGLTEDMVVHEIERLGKLLPRSLSFLEGTDIGSKMLRAKLQNNTEKRWKASFASTGQVLSKRRNKDERRKS